MPGATIGAGLHPFSETSGNASLSGSNRAANDILYPKPGAPHGLRRRKPGKIRQEFWIPMPGVTVRPLSGWTNTRSHPAVSLDTRKAQLTMRRYPDS